MRRRAVLLVTSLPRWVRNVVLVTTDAAVLAAAPWLGLYLRFDGAIPEEYSGPVSVLSVARIALTLVLLARLKMYRSLWRYAGAEETLRSVWAATVATALFAGEIALERAFQFPRSVILLHWFLALAGIGGIRVLGRSVRGALFRSPALPGHRTMRTLIVGAGDAGAMVAQEMLKHRELGHLPIGFIDDDPSKLRLAIHGIEVVGNRESIPRLVQDLRVNEVVLAMPSAPGDVVQDVVRVCGSLGVRLRTVPGVYELLDGHVQVSHLREVRPEDLLSRTPVDLDIESISSYLSGARVLVTGAAGSIGSELCRQLARFQPAALVAVDVDETGLFHLEHGLRWAFPKLKVQTALANIRDEDAVRNIFLSQRPEVVFHAAALKHVPILEHHEDEAAKTNIWGTLVVAHAALEVGTRRVVLVSTDKAVNPTSVLGATKRVSEMVGLAVSDQGPRFIAVRFGNVLGSRGSVVPLFQEQIARGGPITVTHPEMTRFFMTIPEAAQLVIQAGGLGNGGEVFVLDMGEPVKIVDLARTLIRLNGLEPDKDIRVEFSGVRPGERLYEEVLTAEEGLGATRHRRIFMARTASLHLPTVAFQQLFNQLMDRAWAGDRAGVRSSLHELVPNYVETDLDSLPEVAATSESA